MLVPMMTVTALAHTAGDTAGLFWLSRRLIGEHEAAPVGHGQFVLRLGGATTVLLTELDDVLRLDAVVGDELSVRRARRDIEQALSVRAGGAVSMIAWETSPAETPAPFVATA